MLKKKNLKFHNPVNLVRTLWFSCTLSLARGRPPPIAVSAVFLEISSACARPSLSTLSVVTVPTLLACGSPPLRNTLCVWCHFLFLGQGEPLALRIGWGTGIRLLKPSHFWIRIRHQFDIHLEFRQWQRDVLARNSTGFDAGGVSGAEKCKDVEACVIFKVAV